MKYNITFYLENHEDLNGLEIFDILKIVDSERMMQNFDVGNVVNALDNPLEFYELNKPKIGRVHLKDVAIIKY